MTRPAEVPDGSLRRFGGGRFVRVLRVRQGDNASDDSEQHDHTDGQAHKGGLGVGFVRVSVVLVVCHFRLLVAGYWLPAISKRNQATRTEFMTSFGAIFFMTSMPLVILPNTVWTPLR